MDKNKIKGLLIKRAQQSANDEIEALSIEAVYIEENKALNTYYSLINCNVIDIQERFISNKLFDFIIDDEYLLNGKSKEPRNLTALGERKGVILEAIYGPFIIVGTADQEGKETSLNDEDINLIKKAVKIAIDKEGNKYAVINYTFEEETENLENE